MDAPSPQHALKKPSPSGRGLGEGLPAQIDIPTLIPHAGNMCLLDTVTAWSHDAIECRATSHLDPANPLRRGGRLAMLSGVEYALQAAAVHGALRGGGTQPPGYLAALRMARLAPGRLDDRSIGTLAAHARCEHADATGLLYAILLKAADGRVLLEGRATIILTKP